MNNINQESIKASNAITIGTGDSFALSTGSSEVDLGIVNDSSSIGRTFNSDSEEDIYRFEVEGTGKYSFGLDNLSANLNLSIEDSEGNTLYTSAKPGNQAESISAELQSGKYFAKVTAESEVSTDYSFNVTKSSAEDSSHSSQSADLSNNGQGETLLGEGDTVYRFFRSDAQTQFYTTSESERDYVKDNLSVYEYQGESFVGAPNPESNDITGVKSVYRFLNTNTGVHLYTASEVEKDYVTENLSHYTPEGVAYYGYESQQEGTTPLYRFYHLGLDAHFYTPSIEEKDSFLDSADYRPEGDNRDDGIAFYVQSIEI